MESTNLRVEKECICDLRCNCYDFEIISVDLSVRGHNSVLHAHGTSTLLIAALESLIFEQMHFPVIVTLKLETHFVCELVFNNNISVEGSS